MDELALFRAYLGGPSTGIASDELLTLLLGMATEAIMNRLYPYADYDPLEGVPARYRYKQFEVAAYLYNRRGVEGQTVHAENATRREYEATGLPDSMLAEIVPYVKGGW